MDIGVLPTVLKGIKISGINGVPGPGELPFRRSQLFDLDKCSYGGCAEGLRDLRRDNRGLGAVRPRYFEPLKGFLATAK
jgi:hypothetical protein